MSPFFLLITFAIYASTFRYVFSSDVTLNLISDNVYLSNLFQHIKVVSNSFSKYIKVYLVDVI